MFKGLFRGERRERKSTHLKEFCPATFVFQGQTYKATMVDSSRKGAQFGMTGSKGTFPLKQGDEVEYLIRTPYGESHLKGVVKWVELSGTLCQWGVQFSSLLNDESDPVVAYLLSPF